MAKALSTIPPSSSVAKLLEPGVGAAALKPARPPAGLRGDGDAGLREDGDAGPRGPTHAVPEPSGGAADIKRELTLTRSSNQALDELVALYQRTTGSRVHASHVMRALLRAVSLYLPEIERAATALGPLRRARHGPGREAERDAFEDRLAESLLAGLRARGRAG